MTLPEFLENRFHDKKKVLLSISSVVIIIFFLVYTASALASGGKLFHTIFGIDYHIALIIGAAVILTYTFMGGFLPYVRQTLYRNVDVSRIADRANHCFCISQWQVCS